MLLRFEINLEKDSVRDGFGLSDENVIRYVFTVWTYFSISPLDL